MKIFLDPGHGGADPGAVGLHGLRESTVNLEICRVLFKYLAALGHKVEMSRDWDYQTIDLDTRANAANEWGAEAVVSIHSNAAENRSAHGYETWTARGQTAADPLAQRIMGRMGIAQPGEPARVDKTDGDDDKEASFRVLVKSKAPAVLVEVNFISNPDIEERMRSPSWIALVAGSIGVGISDWIKESA